MDSVNINGVMVEICSHERHPNISADSRIPGYYEQPWPDGCINCCFRYDGKKDVKSHLNCGLTQNDRGYFSGVSPRGKCEKYEKGLSLFS